MSKKLSPLWTRRLVIGLAVLYCLVINGFLIRQISKDGMPPAIKALLSHFH